MLVSALMGLDVMRAAYAHAVTQDYRFYSYGDGSAEPKLTDAVVLRECRQSLKARSMITEAISRSRALDG